MVNLDYSHQALKPAILSRKATARIRKVFTALVAAALLGASLLAASVAISNPAGATITFTAPSGLWIYPEGTITVDASAYATESGYSITCGAATGTGAMFTAATFVRTGCSYRITVGPTQGTLTFTVPYTSTSTDTHDGQISIDVGAALPQLQASGCTDGTFIHDLSDPRLPGSNNDLSEDCQALVSLQNLWAQSSTFSQEHLVPPFLQTWGVGTPAQQKVRNWMGITVADVGAEGDPSTRGRVTELRISNTNRLYNLAGNLGAQIGDLSQLTVLDINGYTLAGNIPQQLGSVTTLTSIDLSSNRFTGSIPTQLGSLTNLVSLDLADNQLTSTVPTQLGTITSLTTLGICNNFLTGALPVALRSGVTLTGYPTSSGYDPIQCQNPSSIEFTTPPSFTVVAGESVTVDVSPFASQGTLLISCADVTVVDPKITITSRDGCSYVVMALDDSRGQSSFTVPYSSSSGASIDGPIPVFVTTTASSGLFPPGFCFDCPPPPTTVPPPPPEPSEEPYLRWNFFSVQTGGAVPTEISIRLAASAYPDIWAWNIAEQRWSRATDALPAGALVAFRTYTTPDADTLALVNLGTTRSATLFQEWNILSIPENLTRPEAGTFLLEEGLLDCSTRTYAVIIANYNTRENTWHIWLPCHPDAEAFYTEGAEALYNPLSSITETHPVYLFFASPAPTDILWNSEVYEECSLCVSLLSRS